MQIFGHALSRFRQGMASGFCERVASFGSRLVYEADNGGSGAWIASRSRHSQGLQRWVSQSHSIACIPWFWICHESSYLYLITLHADRFLKSYQDLRDLGVRKCTLDHPSLFLLALYSWIWADPRYFVWSCIYRCPVFYCIFFGRKRLRECRDRTWSFQICITRPVCITPDTIVADYENWQAGFIVTELVWNCNQYISRGKVLRHSWDRKSVV